MEPTAPSYIVRAADTRLFQALSASEYVFLLDSRQKGKSSLVARTMLALKQAGITPIKLDLQRIGANVTPEQWYAGILTGIGEELDLESELFAYWDAHAALGPLARLLGALEHGVLRLTDSPLVIFIDEVDFVRGLPFSTDEFFAGIRDCYNRRSEVPAFGRLTFCLVGVATPGQLIRNPEITPFNVGTSIELSDFTAEDTAGYADVLKAMGRNGTQLMQRVHYWVDGHPYLTQLLCSRIASDPGIRSSNGVDRLVRELLLSPDARHGEPNLADVERRLLNPDIPGMTDDERRAQALDLYGRLLRGKAVEASEENPVVASLRLAGVTRDAGGRLSLRNRVYGSVFGERWRNQNLPEAEMRRQRGAARAALLRTAAVAGVVVLGVTAIAINTSRLLNDRSKALTSLQARTEELNRVSNERKHSLTDLQLKTVDLNRVSNERQKSLADLKLRTEDIKRVSGEREAALSSLEKQNLALKRVSDERQKALTSLGQRSEELQHTNYVGIMSSISVAMNQKRWMRVSELVAQTKTNPLRGWEWGHVAQLVSGHLAEASLVGFRNEFEMDPDGSLNVVTPDAIYKVTTSGLQLRRKFTGRTILPGKTRVGNLRVGIDPKTGRYVVRNADSDKMVAEVSDPKLWQTGAFVWQVDLDPLSMVIRTEDGKFERWTLDMKTRIEKLDLGESTLGFAALSKGGNITVDSSGRIIRRDKSGNILAESKDLIESPSGLTNVALTLSPDQSLFVYSDLAERAIQIRRTSDLNVASTLVGPKTMNSIVKIASDGKTILVGDRGEIIRSYNVGSGNLLNTYVGIKARLLLLAFLPGEREFASLDRAGELRVWPISPAPLVKTLSPRPDPTISISTLNTGKYLVAQARSHAMEFINFQSGTVNRIEIPSGYWGQGAFWAQSGEFVFVGTKEGQVSRLKIEGMKVEQSVQVFDGRITALVPLMGGKRLLAGSNTVPGSGAAKYAIIDSTSMQILHRFVPNFPEKGINFATYPFPISNGPLIAFCANSIGARKGTFDWGTGIVVFVSAESGQTVKRLSFDREITVAALSADGSKLYVVFYTGLADALSRIEVIDTSTFKKIGELEAPTKAAVKKFTAFGRVLTGQLADESCALWDLSGPGRLVTISAGQPIVDYDVSKNGSRFVAVLRDGSVVLWDAKSGEELHTLKMDPFGEKSSDPRFLAAGVAFSADRRKLFVLCQDGSIRIYDSVLWKEHPKTARK